MPYIFNSFKSPYIIDTVHQNIPTYLLRVKLRNQIKILILFF